MKTISFIVLIFLATHCLADESPYDLLNEQDLALELAQEEPYVKGGGMISYDEWRCFPAKYAFANCADADIGFTTFRGEIKISPRIEVTTGKEIHIFQAYNMHPNKCEHTTQALRTLLEREEHFCVYGAVFFDDSRKYPEYETSQTWVMHRVKTKHGVWIGPTDPSYGKERK